MIGTERGLAQLDGLPQEIEDRLGMQRGDRRRAQIRRYLSDLGKATAILQFPAAGILGRIRALRFAKKVIDGKAEPKGISAQELLTRHKQSQDFIDSFWSPLIKATINANPEDASAELFVNVLRLGFLGKSEDARIIIPSEGLSSLFAGFPQWLEHHHSRLNLNHKVSGLIVENGNCRGVIDSNGDKHFADAVILAVPPEPLKKLLSPVSNEYDGFSVLNEYSYSTIISMYLWLDKEIMPEEFSALIDTTAQWAFNRRRLCRSSKEIIEKYPGHIAVTISAGDELEDISNEELLSRVWDDIQSCYDAAKKAKILHHRIIRDKRATFLATPSLEAKRPSNRTHIDNLCLAGDWTNTKLPATIEGAAISGKMAANIIIKNLVNEQV
jgi:zeta-carotene desaturase